MFAAAATRGDVTVKNVIPKHLEAATSKLLEIGCEIEELDDAVRVVCSKGLRCTNIKDASLSRFPHRYAAADYGNAGSRKGKQHRNRKYL